MIVIVIGKNCWQGVVNTWQEEKKGDLLKQMCTRLQEEQVQLRKKLTDRAQKSLDTRAGKDSTFQRYFAYVRQPSDFCTRLGCIDGKTYPQPIKMQWHVLVQPVTHVHRKWEEKERVDWIPYGQPLLKPITLINSRHERVNQLIGTRWERVPFEFKLSEDINFPVQFTQSSEIITVSWPKNMGFLTVTFENTSDRAGQAWLQRASADGKVGANLLSVEINDGKIDVDAKNHSPTVAVLSVSLIDNFHYFDLLDEYWKQEALRIQFQFEVWQKIALCAAYSHRPYHQTGRVEKVHLRNFSTRSQRDQIKCGVA